jgi:hypothetical protein
MPYSRTRILTAVLLLGLAGVACVLTVADGFASAGAGRQAEEFQHLVGGLGLGPAVDLSRCAFSFDPRLCPDCPLNHAPVPGGVYFCPQHACSILYFPPLTSRPRTQAEKESDGRSP